MTSASMQTDEGLIWSGRSKRERAIFLFDLIRTLGVLLTAISLFLTLQAFRWQQGSKNDEYRWKRQELALQLLRDWDDKTSGKRNEIDRLQAKLQGIEVSQNMPPLSKELALAVWSQVGYGAGDLRQRDMYDLRSNLISLLNYFESLAVAYYTEAANKDLLSVSVGSPLRRWKKRLQEFTEIADLSRNEPVWKPFYALVRDLEELSAEEKRLAEAAVLKGVGSSPSHSYGTRP